MFPQKLKSASLSYQREVFPVLTQPWVLGSLWTHRRRIYRRVRGSLDHSITAMVWVGRALRDHLLPLPAMGRDISPEAVCEHQKPYVSTRFPAFSWSSPSSYANRPASSLITLFPFVFFFLALFPPVWGTSVLKTIFLFLDVLTKKLSSSRFWCHMQGPNTTACGLASGFLGAIFSALNEQFLCPSTEVSGAQSSKRDEGLWGSLPPGPNPSVLSTPWLISECVTSGTPLSRVCIPRCKQRLTAEPSSAGAVPIWVANITSPCPFSIKLPPQKTIRSRGCWWVAGLQQHSSGSAARLLSVLLCVFEGRLKKRETFACSWCLLAVWYLIALWGQPVSSRFRWGKSTASHLDMANNCFLEKERKKQYRTTKCHRADFCWLPQCLPIAPAAGQSGGGHGTTATARQNASAVHCHWKCPSVWSKIYRLRLSKIPLGILLLLSMKKKSV